MTRAYSPQLTSIREQTQYRQGLKTVRLTDSLITPPQGHLVQHGCFAMVRTVYPPHLANSHTFASRDDIAEVAERGLPLFLVKAGPVCDDESQCVFLDERTGVTRSIEEASSSRLGDAVEVGLFSFTVGAVLFSDTFC